MESLLALDNGMFTNAQLIREYLEYTSGEGKRMKRRENRRSLYAIVIFFLIVTASSSLSLFHSFLVNAKTKNTTKNLTDSANLAEGKILRIVLDPGHGGSQSGAAREKEQVEEKTLNLKIAKYLKKELETYENVKVYLTRSGDSDVELADRTKFAVKKKADVMISLHNNAAGPCAAYDHGCTVLAAKNGYKDVLALEGQKLSCNILNELSKMGIEDQGILLRDSEAKERYPNGILADYYAIIRGGVENDILTVLIEHAFIDSDSDFNTYLNSDKKLKKLALADAAGIARYYQLVKKIEKSDGKNRRNHSEDNKEQQEEKCVLEPLTSCKEKIVHAVDGNAKHNKVSYRIFYGETDEQQKNISTEDIEAFQRISALADTNSLLDVKKLKEFYSMQNAEISD